VLTRDRAATRRTPCTTSRVHCSTFPGLCTSRRSRGTPADAWRIVLAAAAFSDALVAPFLARGADQGAQRPTFSAPNEAGRATTINGHGALPPEGAAGGRLMLPMLLVADGDVGAVDPAPLRMRDPGGKHVEEGKP